jgi:hypothetical protein
MKKKMFTTVLVLVSLFLAISWVREQDYRTRLKRLNAVVTEMQDRIRRLRLRADALQEEMEMLNISTYLRLVKGWKEDSRPGIRP